MIPQVEPKPPTIASLKRIGVSRFRVTCGFAACRHSAHVTFEAAGVTDAVAFPEITERRRFRCTACGGHGVFIMPDWSTHQVAGVGSYSPQGVENVDKAGFGGAGASVSRIRE